MCCVSDIPGARQIPRALVVLLENVVRRAATLEEAQLQAARVVWAGLTGTQAPEVDFWPARVLFQDFTGVPIFVDFAAMRDAAVARGLDPRRVNPRIPCDLVIDHSVMADVTSCPQAAAANQALELERNAERFSFLKWAAAAFDNVRIVPPGQGICHQLNVEALCQVVTHDALFTPATCGTAGAPVAGGAEQPQLLCFDTLVGSDSHTPTANGLGVLGWGVGGIEAEAAALGQPLPMRVPQVVNLYLTGSLGPLVQGMDVALTLAKRLREFGVVGAFVEVTGPGVASLSATQRACIANMTPEYGATATLFPVDDATFDYLALTARPAGHIEKIKRYVEAQGILGEGAEHRVYGRTLEFNLSEVEPCLAGPAKPHEHVALSQLAATVEATAAAHGHGDTTERFTALCEDGAHELAHGALAIAAITSCTTATDPSMLIAAGLVARRARELGLTPKPWVKKILAPGSHAALAPLKRTGLLSDLEALGFAPTGFGCMSCIGNSAELLEPLKPLAASVELTSVLSGNRNFEGRIHPDVSQNYLCQPALVVAYSLAGTMDIDVTCEPVGHTAAGEAVMLEDLMPTAAHIEEALAGSLDPALYAHGAATLFEGDAAWQALAAPTGDTYAWDPASTYIRRPPYFEDAQPAAAFSFEHARALVFAPDFTTTDHISPAGAIAPTSPAGAYLEAHGVAKRDFNSYGSRRGNHEVMARGTFANVKFKNRLAEGAQGSVTREFLGSTMTSIFEAATAYRAAGVQEVVLAGKLYGSGSSRDWAAKGPALLGVRAVIAESFERIHRSNLVGMGILPLELIGEASLEERGITGRERFSLDPLPLGEGFVCDPTVCVRAVSEAGEVTELACVARVDTLTEATYLAKGGILPYVLEELA
jgi:aconitate hydratase